MLSSYDSGVLAPAGANELLGLVSSLLPLGTAGVIAAIVPLNDHATVSVMVDLHRFIRSGWRAGPAHATAMAPLLSHMAGPDHHRPRGP